MPHPTQPREERPATSTPESQSGVLVVRIHHLLVRCSHWLTVPLLLGLVLSGMSIYWASPVYHHTPDPVTGSSDPLRDAGLWICAHVPGLHQYSSPSNWVYNHISLGPGLLAVALRLHWLCAYLLMLNGLVYVMGLVMGGGWRSLLPRGTDLHDAWKMFCYYLGVPIAKLLRRAWMPPRFKAKYNALQRAAYFSVVVAGLLSVLTGWAIHKPSQLSRLAAIFGGYDRARIWHFWLLWFFVLFVVPHVILVLADGWDTFRSMITGWSKRRENAMTSGHDPISPCGSKPNPSRQPLRVFRKQPVPTKSLP